MHIHRIDIISILVLNKESIVFSILFDEVVLLTEDMIVVINVGINIDILDVKKARKILDSYNFMCIAILNQSTEVASILYDTGDDTYEMIPFSGLEREASDNSYKKMVNLLSKVSR